MEGSQLAQIFADQGIAPGYMRGEKQGTDLASTIARTKQQGLESDRYAAETPDYLQQQGYATEKARLGNLQGQADEAAGANTAKAQLEARKAQEAFKTLPLETQQKMRQMTVQKTNDLLNILEQAITTSGNTNAGIEAVTGAYPEIVNDKGWQAAIKQYQGLSPEQVLAKVKQTRHGLASSNAYADPAMQGKMIQENQDQSGRMDLAKLNNDAAMQRQQAGDAASLAAVNVRSTSSGGSMNKYEALQFWGDAARNATTKEDYEYANSQFKAIQGEQEASGTNLLGQPVGGKAKVDAPNPKFSGGGSSDKATLYRQYRAAWDRATTQEQKKALTAKAIEMGVAGPTK